MIREFELAVLVTTGVAAFLALPLVVHRFLDRMRAHRVARRGRKQLHEFYELNEATVRLDRLRAAGLDLDVPHTTEAVLSFEDEDHALRAAGEVRSMGFAVTSARRPCAGRPSGVCRLVCSKSIRPQARLWAKLKIELTAIAGRHEGELISLDIRTGSVSA